MGSKRNSLYGSKTIQEQIPIPAFVEKIKAFRAASKSGDMMHISRIESLVLDRGMGDALDRAYAFLDAGTDGVVIHSVSKTADEVFSFCTELRSNGVHAPVLVIPTTYWNTPFDAFQDRGVSGVIYANQLLRAVVKPMQAMCESILARGRVDERAFGDTLIAPTDLFDLIPSRPN